jgi:hypothetical protein
MFAYSGKVFGQKEFIPDTTINSILLLRDIPSAALFYSKPDSITRIIIDKELDFFGGDHSPFILFLNTSKTKYLTAIIHEGTWENYFSEFEIGEISDSILKEMDIPYIVTTYQDFQTENNIHIGMSIKALEQLKGKNYVRIDNKIKYCYNSLDLEFLEFGECEYYLESELINGRIVKFRFGYTPI